MQGGCVHTAVVCFNCKLELHGLEALDRVAPAINELGWEMWKRFGGEAKSSADDELLGEFHNALQDFSKALLQAVRQRN